MNIGSKIATWTVGPICVVFGVVSCTQGLVTTFQQNPPKEKWISTWAESSGHAAGDNAVAITRGFYNGVRKATPDSVQKVFPEWKNKPGDEPQSEPQPEPQQYPEPPQY